MASLTADQNRVKVAALDGEAPDLAFQLARLQALLEEYDSEASDLVPELESLAADTEYLQAIRVIGERIAEFEFDEALGLLKGLRKAMVSSMAGSATGA